MQHVWFIVITVRTCVSVCVCARVRAIRGTQAVVGDAALMRANAPQMDEQGQSILHLVAWRAPARRTLRATRVWGKIRGRFGWVA